jgi:hypothetical protein
MAELTEVFDTEAEGARHATRLALPTAQRVATQNITFPTILTCIGSSVVLWCLRGTALATSQEMSRSTGSREPLCRKALFHWVPSHEGIAGSELADQLANKGAIERDSFVFSQLAISFAKRIKSTMKRNSWIE